jgi:uroporphyrin-3 C-methyltransferase
VAKTSKPAAPDAPTKQNETPQVEKKTKAVRSPGRSKTVLKTLLVIVVVALLAGGAWFLQHYWQMDRQDMLERIGMLSSKVSSLEQNYSSSDKSIVEQTQLIDDVQKFATDLAQTLSQQNQQLRELSLAAPENRLIAEALHLSQLASWRVQTERSNRIPLILLENADTALARLKGVDVAAARNALAADMRALRDIDGVDAEAVFIEISQIATKVDQLTMTKSAPVPSSALERSATEPDSEIAILDRFIGNLSQLVRIRQHDQPVTPLLQAADQKTVRHNLSFQFQYAQTALLLGQQKLYQQSLTAAKTSLERFFLQTADLQSILKQLDQLIDVRIAVPLPRVNGSVQAVQELMQNAPAESSGSQGQTP